MILILGACGGGGGNNPAVDASTDKMDARVFLDAPPNVPAMITISGTATEQASGGGTPLPGATIGIFKTSDETTALATTTSDAQGNYSLVLTTNGLVVDGFIKTSKSGYADNYAYPVKPWEANTSADPQLLKKGTFDALRFFVGSDMGKGLVVINVVDASDMPVAGATVSSTPASGKYAYSDASGNPSTSVTATAADGLAFMLSVPPGQITISADKSGATFKSHALNAHADAFTTTSITE